MAIEILLFLVMKKQQKLRMLLRFSKLQCTEFSYPFPIFSLTTSHRKTPKTTRAIANYTGGTPVFPRHRGPAYMRGLNVGREGKLLPLVRPFYSSVLQENFRGEYPTVLPSLVPPPFIHWSIGRSPRETCAANFRRALGPSVAVNIRLSVPCSRVRRISNGRSRGEYRSGGR